MARSFRDLTSKDPDELEGCSWHRKNKEKISEAPRSELEIAGYWGKISFVEKLKTGQIRL